MNRTQVAQLMAVLREEYPNGPDITEERIGVWDAALRRARCTDYREAQEAVMRLLTTWDGYTMPPVGALIKAIEEARPTDDTAIELWNIADKLISKGTILTEEEFQNAPAPIKRYFGSVARIKELALMPPEQSANERARFLKVIPDMARSEKAYAELPESVKQIADSAAKTLTLITPQTYGKSANVTETLPAPAIEPAEEEFTPGRFSKWNDEGRTGEIERSKEC